MLAALLWLVAPAGASASWPGRDGLLALQPLHGAGIELVSVDGHLTKRVCPQPARHCGVVRDPVWSPDGRKLAFAAGSTLSIVYADGSCLACQINYDSNAPVQRSAVFDADGRRLVFVYEPTSDPAGLWTVGEDGIDPRDPISLITARQLPAGAAGSSPAVSVDGRIAFVRRLGRRDWVFLTNRARTRSAALAPGDRPSWSPDGRSLAFDHRGVIELTSLLAGAPRALARGSAPAWSPRGRWVAYLDPEHHPSLVPAGGGAGRRITRLRARHLDWQPIVAGPPRCDPPTASKIVIQTPELTVTHRTDEQGNTPYMACWGERGLLRFLGKGYSFEALSLRRVFGFALAGHDLAFQISDSSEGEATTVYVAAFDLARGQLFADRAGYVDGTQPFDASSVHTGFGIESLLASPNGAAAWLSQATGYTSSTTTTTSTATSAGAKTTTTTDTTFNSNPSTTYEITAHDRLGRRQLDSASQTGSTSPLSGLRLSGNVISWRHDGVPRRAELR